MMVCNPARQVLLNLINHPIRLNPYSMNGIRCKVTRKKITHIILMQLSVCWTPIVRHSGRDAGIRTPVRAYYQYGESPYQSKPKPLKLKVTASPGGGVESNWK